MAKTKPAFSIIGVGLLLILSLPSLGYTPGHQSRSKQHGCFPSP